MANGSLPLRGFDNPIDGPKTLLTVYPDEAVALGLVKGKVASAQTLASQQGFQLVADLTPGYGEKLVELLNNSIIRSLLLLIFLQSLYIALNAPGHGAAEAVAVVSLGLLIGVPLLTGYAQWWEVALIFLGLRGSCAFEIFVFPGYMVSLIVGTIMLLFRAGDDLLRQGTGQRARLAANHAVYLAWDSKRPVGGGQRVLQLVYPVDVAAAVSAGDSVFQQTDSDCNDRHCPGHGSFTPYPGIMAFHRDGGREHHRPAARWIPPNFRMATGRGLQAVVSVSGYVTAGTEAGGRTDRGEQREGKSRRREKLKTRFESRDSNRRPGRGTSEAKFLCCFLVSFEPSWSKQVLKG